MPITAPAIVSGLSGLYSLATGIGERKAAQKRAKMNIRPMYEIQDEYFDNQRLAEANAMSGLPEATKSFYNSSAERGLGTGISAALAAGYGVNDIQGFYDSFNRNELALASEDAQARVRNIGLLIDQNTKLADQKTQQWALNKYEPYKDNAKANSESMRQANASINNGLNSVISAASSYATSKLYGDGDSGGSAAPVPGRSAGLPAANFTAALPQAPAAAGMGTDYSAQINNVLKKYQNSPYYADLENMFLRY